MANILHIFHMLHTSAYIITIYVVDDEVMGFFNAQVLLKENEFLNILTIFLAL